MDVGGESRKVPDSESLEMILSMIMIILRM